MIILELSDGTIKKFNLPTYKEKMLLSVWQEFNNKSINLTTKDQTINIKLIDIENCYIKKDTSSLLDDIPTILKDMLFGKGI